MIGMSWRRGVRKVAPVSEWNRTNSGFAPGRQMEAFDVDFAEQPIHESDKQGLRQIRQSTAIKIEADEFAKSLADVYDLIAMGCG